MTNTTFTTRLAAWAEFEPGSTGILIQTYFEERDEDGQLVDGGPGWGEDAVYREVSFPDGWAASEDNIMDEDAVDAALLDLGYERCEPWSYEDVPRGGIATVEAVATALED
jgi:hypothetical protein